MRVRISQAVIMRNPKHSGPFHACIYYGAHFTSVSRPRKWRRLKRVNVARLPPAAYFYDKTFTAKTNVGLFICSHPIVLDCIINDYK